MNNLDQQFMQKALQLARRAPVTSVSPNPRVGAVIVKNGKVIGEGYHAKFGASHAEAIALSRCKTSPRDATLYTTLEPCCYWGNTPPCTDAVIAAGIKKVVCAVKDPNARINGKGIKILRQKGVRVEVGVMADEAKKLNETFFYFHLPPISSPLKGERQRGGLPFVAVKVAASIDGKIATRTGESKWITSTNARAYARGLRAEYQAILVGANTVRHDNPHLGVRKTGVPDPLRIILDFELKTPVSAKVFRDTNVIVCTKWKVENTKVKRLEKKGVRVWKFAGRRVPIKLLLKRLAKEKIASLLVEGGGEIIGSFMDAHAVNKIYWFRAPLIIGGRESINSVGGRGSTALQNAIKLKQVEHKKIDRDTLTIGYIS